MMPENTKTEAQNSNAGNPRLWTVFAFVVVFVYLFGLTIPLLGPDEPRYSQVAREMFLRGDWVTPTLGGFDWFEKPVLLYWLQIAFYNVFGVSEFAARLGSALFGLGTILSLWILGKRSAEEPKTGFANWLALIAASSIGLLAFARGASFDIILTFPVTASLVGFFVFERLEEKRFFNLPLAVFYFFIGVALLAKGLVGIVFPFAIVAFYYVLSWKMPSKAFLFSLVWGIVLSLLVASAWYLPMYQTNGWKFIDEFFIQHHFQRYTSNKYLHPQPFWFFFLVLPLMTIPWMPFFLAAIYKFFKAQFLRIKARESESEDRNAFNSPLALFAFAWMAVPLVFFSFSGSKLPGYILPALPGAVILTALYVHRFVNGSDRRGNALQALAAATFVVVVALLLFVVPRFADADSTKSLIAAANAEGFENERIVNLYTVAHNAEFYAAGRLVRESGGKLKRYDDFSKLYADLQSSESKRILVLVPQKDAKNLIADHPGVNIRILDEKGELAIAAVSAE